MKEERVETVLQYIQWRARPKEEIRRLAASTIRDLVADLKRKDVLIETVRKSLVDLRDSFSSGIQNDLAFDAYMEMYEGLDLHDGGKYER